MDRLQRIRKAEDNLNAVIDATRRVVALARENGNAPEHMRKTVESTVQAHIVVLGKLFDNDITVY